MTSSPFVEGGFSNWKKALLKFYQHERNELHRESSLKLAAKGSAPDIVCQLRLQHDKELQTNRAMLLKVLQCETFLARLGLALRGHREDSNSFEGNLYQLLLLRANDITPLKPWLQKPDYISPATINEIIKICGNTVLQCLLKDIKGALQHTSATIFDFGIFFINILSCF